MFFCKECGYESSKWMGQCPACREWNSFGEGPVVSGEKSPAARKRAPGRGAAPVRLADISLEEQDRTKTGFGELDRVLGDGIVKGSLCLWAAIPVSESPRSFSRSAATWRWRESASFIFPARSP